MNRDNLPVQFFAPLGEQELEAHIASCGHLMVSEYEAGNRESAENWLQAMYEAIRARPQVVATDSCYFDACGAADRLKLCGPAA